MSDMNATRGARDRLHGVTVLLAAALVCIPVFFHIDPHGGGNAAFRWHSLSGVAIYLLAGSQLILWLIDTQVRRATGQKGPARTASVTSGRIFYALLVVLPLTGWVLASEEGVPVHSLLFPALPQWLAPGPPVLAGGTLHRPGMVDTPLVTALIRIHWSLAASLVASIAVHAVFTVRASLGRDRHRRAVL